MPLDFDKKRCGRLDPEGLALETLAIRTGHERSQFAEHCEPIYTTSSFVFNSAEQAAARFDGQDEGYIYSRFTNPTVAAFQQRLATMEGGESCIATASGMSAILATVLALLEQGDHIIASKSMFGSTVNLFDKLLPRIGISVSWVELSDVQAWSDALQPGTRMLFLETPTNPLVSLGDIAAISQLVADHPALVVVDNCFCTPALQKPLSLGADLVIHSATKYIDGQGRCLGGAIVGPTALIDEAIFAYMRSAGPSLSPFNAWVFLKGLETLTIRMERHCESTSKIAEWLDQHDQVSRVHYPGLTSHPQHLLCQQQQSRPGAVVSLELDGGQEAAWKMINQTRLFSITANLGDAKSTITHPTTTTHARMSESDRLAVGVTPGLVRIAVGLEQVDDLLDDLSTALTR